MLVKKCTGNFLLIALSLFIVAEKSSQLEVDIVCCNVESEEFYISRSRIMSCVMPSLSIIDFNTTIRSTKALYVNRRAYTTASIEVIYFRNAPNMHFMPLGIKKSFPKLKGLVINQAGLFHLDQQDMKPFGADLLWILIEHTQLTALSGDLFAENPNLVYIDFESNPLMYIDSQFFENFKRMRFAKEIDMRSCGCMSKEFKQWHGHDINTFDWSFEACNEISVKIDHYERTGRRNRERNFAELQREVAVIHEKVNRIEEKTLNFNFNFNAQERTSSNKLSHEIRTMKLKWEESTSQCLNNITEKLNVLSEKLEMNQVQDDEFRSHVF